MSRQPRKKPSIQPRPAVDGRRPNTVGLGQRDLELVLDQLDRPGLPAAARRRAFVRWEFRCPSVRLDLLQRGGAGPAVLVATRNLSAGGVSVLHSAYAHQGTEVVIHLPNLRGASVPLRGVIRMCRHVQGVIHEIGIEFDRPIDARAFVKLHELDDQFSLERVDPAKLIGRVLCVTASEMDQKLIEHYVRETRLTVLSASTAAEGLIRVAEGVDIVIADLDLPDMTGAAFASALAEAGGAAPVIILTPDASSATRQRLGATAPGAFLPKPLEQETLLRALAEFCLMQAGAGPLLTSLAEGSPNAALVPEFIAYLATAVEKLQACIEVDDFKTCSVVALQIAGVAPAVGFAPIADAAQAAALAVTSSMSVRESEAVVQALIALCERTRPSKAA